MSCAILRGWHSIPMLLSLIFHLEIIPTSLHASPRRLGTTQPDCGYAYRTPDFVGTQYVEQ